MDLATIIQNLVDRKELPCEAIDGICEQTRNQIFGNQLKIVELVKSLDPVLTSTSHEVRLEGVKILVNVIVSMPFDLLSTKEIEVMNEFLCMRLIDHKSMQPIVLKSFAYFVKCTAKPSNYDRNLLDFFSSKANVQKMDPSNRLQVYQITRTIIQDRTKISSNIDAELIYSFVNLIEGESHPCNLILCFGMVSFILKTFQNLEPFIDDLFEWLSSYYPVEYTPDEEDEQQVGILRSDLVEALFDCFYATPLNAENLQTLLLEKLSSNLLSSKLESLECLIKCYDLFPYESIEPYSSTLWTAVRMDCLKKSDLVNPKLLDTSYLALYSLCKKLESGDPERLTSFVGDLLEELFIAFRKPEMDLFEPAAKLLTQAAKPKISCFNMILDKIIPVALNAINSNELRPLEGLAYIFEHVHTSNPETLLALELCRNINKLFDKINTLIPTNSQAMRLLNAISSCRVPIDDKILEQTIERLFNDFDKSNEQAEESLAMICANYGKMEIIFGPDVNLNNELSSLLEFSKVILTNAAEDANKLAKLSAYTRLLILHLDSADSPRLSNIELKTITEHLATLRGIAIQMKDRSRIVENIGRIHSILINKLDDNVQPVMMQLFSSEYCQRLVPEEACDNSISAKAYLPIIGWCLKSLVVRNHELSAPLINLLLNFMTSDKVDHQLSLIAYNLFGFVLSDEHLSIFDTHKHYRMFVLHKQKFYMQTSKEIKIRYAKYDEDSKKRILLCSLATQVPHLSPSVYKRDHEWLLRQMLMMLSKISHKGCDSNSREEQLLYTFYGSIEALIQPGACDNLAGFLNTIVELNLKHAIEAKTMRIRQRALICLLNVANSFKESDLIILRPMVMDKLRACLKDRKRLVRQAAANARLKWSILGQPVGSN